MLGLSVIILSNLISNVNSNLAESSAYCSVSQSSRSFPLFLDHHLSWRLLNLETKERRRRLLLGYNFHLGYNELQVSEEQVWKPALTTQDIHTNLEQDKDDEEVSWKLLIISGRQFL